MATTPNVQYSYSEMAGGANHSRMTGITYPNGRTINHIYASGPDDTISRLSSLTDTSGTLEGYSYLGLDTVVKRSHTLSGIDQTFIKLAAEGNGDAGDQYVGLDRFNRVAEMRWLKTSDSSFTDRFKYGYDRNGNRLYRENVLNTLFSELYHANGASAGYDALNQLSAFRRGTLSDSNSDNVPDTVTTASRTQEWTFDALGNWSSVVSDGSTQTRSHNQQNQITSISGLTTPGYDGNGNTTSDEQGRTLRYDAWNRLVEVKQGSTSLAAYSSDALRRRVTENSGTARALYYSADWQLIEERESGVVRVQTVFSPVYVDALVLRDRDADGNGSLEERLWVQQDASWNVTALLGVSGITVERYAFDVYGAFLILTDAWSIRSTSSYAWVRLHQGRPYSSSTGLSHFRHREGSSTIGGWLQWDPFGYADDVNQYRFVRGNPINAVDPFGLAALSPTGVSSLHFRRRGVLLAVDGTSSRQFLDGTKHESPAPRTNSGRWRSHVRNFYDDYSGAAKAYWHGPNNYRTGSDAPNIHRGVMLWLQHNWCKDTLQPIDMVGHSRGGYIVMEVARELRTRGIVCSGRTLYPTIRFMGLYDPVDMAPGYGEAETIPGNVDSAYVVFAAGQPGGTVSGSRDHTRSRWYFNRADGGSANNGTGKYREVWIFATHAGIGGAPWDGDHPAGHTRVNDVRRSIESDQWIRRNAILVGVPIPLVRDYGF